MFVIWSMSLKKLLDFFDSGMLQLFDFELRPYRSNDSMIGTRSGGR